MYGFIYHLTMMRSKGYIKKTYGADFWKQFNRIEVKPTRELEDPLLPEHGVDGDTSETLYPDIQHPDHYYTVQHFFNAGTELL